MKRNRVLIGLCSILIACVLFSGVFPGHTQTFLKRLIGTADVFWATGGTGVAETFTATAADGKILTFTKPDATHLKFRTPLWGAARSVDSIVPRLGYEVWIGDPNYPTLDAALADAGLTSGTIVVPAGTHTLSSSADRTLKVGLNLRVLRGGIVGVPNLRTLTLSGTFEAGLYQVFSCAGTGKVVLAGTRYPEWWGADNTGAVDSRAALLAGIHCGPGSLDLRTGTFMIRQAADPCVINIARSDVRITGNGWTLINHSDIDAGGFTGFRWYMLGVYENAAPVENIVIENGILKGNITATMYQVLQQWRHGLFFGTELSTVKNVTLRNMFMDNHGGDGTYLGSNVIGYHEENVRYRDCLRSSWVLAGTGGCEDIWVNESKELAATKTSGRIGNVSINAPGTGYAVNDILTVVQAGASGGTLKVASIGGAGEVLTVTRQDEGELYSIANGLATTVAPAGGTSCTINILSMAFVGTTFHVEINAGGTGTANNIWLTNNHPLRGISITGPVPMTGVVVAYNRGEGGLLVYRCTRPIITGNTLTEPVGWITNNYLENYRSLIDPIVSDNQIIATTGAAASFVSRMSGDTLSASVVDNYQFKNCKYVSKSTTAEGFYAINQNGVTLDNVTAISSGNIAGRVSNCINPRVIGGNYNSTGASADALRVFATATSLAYRTVAEIRGVTAKADTGFYDIYTSGLRRVSIGNIADKYFNGSTNQEWPARYGGGIGKFYRDTAPDYGVWKVGDRRYRANIVPGNVEGQICTFAGANILGAWTNATLGTEKVNDVGFADAAQWTDSGTTFVVAAGVATGTLTSDTLTNTGGAAAIAGTWYRLTADITVTAGSVQLGAGGAMGTAISVTAAVSQTVLATITGQPFLIGAGFTGTVDNFSVKPLTLLYNIGDFVSSGGIYYESLQNANFDKTPATPSTWWVSRGTDLALWENLGQTGYRTGTATPVGAITPLFIGEEYFDTAAKVWYKSKGTVNTDWSALY